MFKIFGITKEKDEIPLDLFDHNQWAFEHFLQSFKKDPKRFKSYELRQYDWHGNVIFAVAMKELPTIRGKVYRGR